MLSKFILNEKSQCLLGFAPTQRKVLLFVLPARTLGRTLTCPVLGSDAQLRRNYSNGNITFFSELLE